MYPVRVHMDNQIVKSCMSQHACYVMNRIAESQDTYTEYVLVETQLH